MSNANFPQVITKASLWVDGNNYLGELEQVKLPDIETDEKDFRGGNAAGTIKVPTGTNLTQCEFTVRRYDPGLYLTYGLIPGKPVDVAIRASLQQDSANGKLHAIVRGTWKTMPGGELKTGEFSDQQFSISPQVYILTLDDTPCIHVDIPGGVVKVGARDILQELAALAGL